jgi:hypothetical protein
MSGRGRCLLASLVFAGACACSPAAHAPASATATAATLKPMAVPSELAGLRAQEEDVGKSFKQAGRRAFVSSVHMWTLREGTRLRATLEVARFADDAPAATDDFRRQVAGQIGGSEPRVRKIGDDKVFVAAGNRQVYYTWFRGRHLILLSIPATARDAKSLARAAVHEVQP